MACSNISNSELNFNNYTVYRCDRSLSNSNCNVGGGVLIAVDSNLKSKILNVSIKSVEHLFVHEQLGLTTYIL